MSFTHKNAPNSHKPDILSYREAGLSWEKYKEYLHKHGLLSPNVPLGPPPAKSRDQTGKPSVQWYSKSWDQFTDDDKQKLARHLVSLGEEKANEYAVFLRDKAFAPHNLIGYLGVYFEEQKVA